MVVHGLLIGGIGRSRDIPTWVRMGPNVARLAAASAARLEAERAYVADAAELREAVARGDVPAGVGVRRWRAHRDALASRELRLFGGSVAVLAALFALGLMALCLVGTATGAWGGVAILATLWTLVGIGAVCRGIKARRERLSDVLRT